MGKMKCPRCDIDLTVIMAEAMATWFRCEKCGGEIVRPDPASEHGHPFYMERRH
jgi:predicted RNA-binding Zn-ribbon protein involved in translation (DUF1610 family)